jgi:subtilisin family serine protease
MSVSLKACLVSLVLLLGACGGGGGDDASSGGGSGGGGGGGGGAAPGTTTPPASTPPSTPTSTDYNTTEFQRNWGLGAVKALAAYEDGLSGDGIVVGVIDSGIDLDQSELTPNIHAASKDIFDGSVNALVTVLGGTPKNVSETRPGGADLDDIDGHGTFVAGLIAAQRNGVRSHGLAFEAKILAVRADDPGSCATDCNFNDDYIAAALNYAVANGANIVNMSLGGSPANSYLEGAIRDATAADVVIVISAGNAPEETAPFSPDADADPFALAAREPWANGAVIIAGSADAAGNISDFSNRAGAGMNYYLLAPGEDLYSTAVASGSGATTFGTGSGTSFAAPLVAAAAALLMEKFPALTAAEIVDILLTSATDLGPVGVDATTGHGLLNLEAAIAPLGTTALSIKTSTGLILTQTGEAGSVSGGIIAGGLFGDGFGTGLQGGAVFTDRYDRAYTNRFDGQIHTVSPFADFASRFEAAENYETGRLDLGDRSALAFAARYDGARMSLEDEGAAWMVRRDMAPDRSIDHVRIRIETQFSDFGSTSVGLGGPLEAALDPTGGIGTSGAFLAQGTRLPWLSETSASASDNGVMSGGRRYGASYKLPGGYSLSAAAGEDRIGVPHLDALSRGVSGSIEEATRATTAIRLGHTSRRGAWALTYGQIVEEGTVLGSFSSGVFGLGEGAETDLLALGGEAALGAPGSSWVSLFGHLAGATIRVDEVALSAFSGYQGLRATQFALGVSLDNAALNGNRLSLTLSQPLRLEGGRVVYGFASGYDYASDTPLYDGAARSIAPSGRELDLELAWHFGVGEGTRVSANLLYQREPGHVSGRDDSVSLMLTGRSAF